MIAINEWMKLASLDERQLYILIEMVQKDAYNQAIKDAALNAKIKDMQRFGGNCGEFDESYSIIDHESILKLLM